MSATSAGCSAAGARAAVLGCLVVVVVAGSGVCQTGEAKVTIVTTGPLRYAVGQQGDAVPDPAAIPGGQAALQPVVATTTPGESYVGYDVTLLDLAKPRGALDAIQEGSPLVLTPRRLAELRRRHASALAGGLDEQAWSDLVADLVGRPVAATAKGERAATGGDGAWALPQRRLLWELLKLGAAPQLFLDFDAADRPRVWGALSGRPVVAVAGAQLQQAGPQRDLLDASGAIQGLVLVRNEDGRLAPSEWAVGVVITGTPGGHRKSWTVMTDSTGYFCWPCPEDAGGAGRYSVGVPGTDKIAEVSAAQGCWSNVVIISEGPLPEGPAGEKGIGRVDKGASDAVGFVSALTGLLAGTGADKIIPQLSSTGLPLQTGAIWSPHRPVRAYYGVERTLAPSSYDRSLRALGPANVIVEFWRYPLVSQPGKPRRGEVERSYRELARTLSDAAEARHQQARDEAEASSAELDRLAKTIQEARPEENAAAYKALVEAQIELRKERRERGAEAEGLAAVHQVQLDFCDQYSARELQAIGPRGEGAQELWRPLRDTYNRDGALPEAPTTDDICVLGVRIAQQLKDDSARVERLGLAGQVRDPGQEHLGYEGEAQRHEDQGYVRFLRVRLVATGVPADQVTIENRLRPGTWGMSAGLVTGGGGSQPAVGGWWLWERLGLRLTAGGTFAASSLPGQLMLGVGVQVPLGGGGGSGSRSTSAASEAKPSQTSGPSGGSAEAGTGAAPAGGPSDGEASAGSTAGKSKPGASDRRKP